MDFYGFSDKAAKQSASNKDKEKRNKCPNPFLAKDKPVEILIRTKRSRGHMGILSSAFASYS